MTPYFTERFGNPAALHTVGDRATQVLEESRAAVAGFIGAQPEEIVFTSGATESNNLALIGHAHRNKRVGDHVVISEVEHISLHNVGKYLEKEDFRGLLSIRNDLGLLSEGYDVEAGRLVGNFPQAFSHVGLVNTVRNLGLAGIHEDTDRGR